MAPRLTTTGQSYQDPPNRNTISPEDLKGTSYEGAAIVGNDEGFFSTGSSDEQVVIAGGVAGKAVTLTTASVLPPGVFVENATETALAASRQDSLDKSLKNDGQNRFLLTATYARARLVSRLGGRNFEEDLTEDVEKREIRNLKKFQDNVVNVNTNNVLKDGHPPVKRYLQQFSQLIFSRSGSKIIMPFFENPRIEEKRGANYSITPTAGSTTPLIVFNHTEFATIKISFRLNPLHISEMLIKEGNGSISDFIFSIPSFYDTKFPSPETYIGEQGTNNSSNTYLGKIKLLNQLIGEYKQKFSSDLPDMLKNWEFGGENQNVLYNYQNLPSLDQVETNYKRAQALCLCWIYLIRESVFFRMNSGTSPIGESDLLRLIKDFLDNPTSAGDTQILLRHGPAFFYIPCVLVGYEIKEATDTTYDVPTHMANVFDISLTLYATPEAWRLLASNAGVNTDGIKLMGIDGGLDGNEPAIEMKNDNSSSTPVEVELQQNFQQSSNAPRRGGV